jgi:hypothetical protein
MACYGVLPDDITTVVLSFLHPYFIIHTISFVSKRWNENILPDIWQEIGHVPKNFEQQFNKLPLSHSSYYKVLNLQWARQSLRYLSQPHEPLLQRSFFVSWKLFVEHNTVSYQSSCIIMQAKAIYGNVFQLCLSPEATTELVSFVKSEISYCADPIHIICSQLFKPIPWSDYNLNTQILSPLLIPNYVQVYGMCRIVDNRVYIDVEKLLFVERLDNKHINLDAVDNADQIKSEIGSVVTGYGCIDGTYTNNYCISISLDNNSSMNNNNNINSRAVLYCGDQDMRKKIGIPQTADLNVIERVPIGGFSRIKFRGRIVDSDMRIAVDRVDLVGVGVHLPNMLICLTIITIFGWIMTQGLFLSREYSALLGEGKENTDNWLQDLAALWRFAVTIPLTLIPGFLACMGLSGLCNEIFSVIKQVRYRIEHSFCT